MTVVRAAERADYTFEAGGHDSDTLRVLRLRGTEGLSQLFRYDIELTSHDPNVSFDGLVGEKATLAWKGMDETRYVHGIVSRFEFNGQGRHLTYYTARLVPRLWFLTRRSQSRIFQNLATPDILKKVFEEGGVSSDSVKYSLKRSYKPRKYCVQYRETDFEFASRLMEEEGIFYFFQHDEKEHILLVADDPVAHVEIPGETTLAFKPGESGLTGGERVGRFRVSQSVKTGAVTLRDYDFKKPSLDLETISKADVEDALEVYEYPGDYPDSSMGKELVKIRLEEARAERERGEGDGNARLFIPGYKFSLEGHPRDEFNQEYLIVRVQHWGRQPQAAEEEALPKEEGLTYENTFQCIPASVPFRPPRLTPRPRIEGPQTAVVTGPSGEEIHTDEHGRIKVHFHWDRHGSSDDKSSCWIRVSQGWGGAGWGGMYIPRIGHEVVVDFLEGDPDRPLVTGRVYNGANPPPYGLPGDKTKSTIKSNSSPGGGGANELRFEDAAGSEEVFFNATKDQNEVVGNNRTREVGANETVHVAKNRDKTVDVDQSETIGANKKIKVGANHDETIGGNMTLGVTGNVTETVSGSRTNTITAALTETVLAAATQTVAAAKTTAVGGALTVGVAGEMSETVGGGRSETIGGDSSETVAGAKSITSGGDFSVATGASGNVKTSSSLTITVGAKAAIDVSSDLAITSKANAAFKAKKIVIQADDEIILKSGSATIALKKNGDIAIKGNKIDIKGSGNVVIKGAKVNQN